METSVETSVETSQEPELKLVPLGEIRDAFVQREQERILRILRRDRMNSWAAGIMLGLLVAIGASMLLLAPPSFKGSANTVDVRHPR